MISRKSEQQNDQFAKSIGGMLRQGTLFSKNRTLKSFKEDEQGKSDSEFNSDSSLAREDEA